MKLQAHTPAQYLAGDEVIDLWHPSVRKLAALLRNQGIPTGLCYQRLTEDGSSFDLHGLVALHLRGDWHRQDPRGNKPGVDAQFSLTTERLAWPVRTELGECDYPQLLVSPHPGIVRALASAADALALCRGGLPTPLASTHQAARFVVVMPDDMSLFCCQQIHRLKHLS